MYNIARNSNEISLFVFRSRTIVVNFSCYPDYPDYGPNTNYGSWLQIQITDSGLRICTTDPDYESVLRIRITDNRSRLRNTDPDNFGNHRLKMDKGLPHFYTDNLSRDDRTNEWLVTSDFGQNDELWRNVILFWFLSLKQCKNGFGQQGGYGGCGSGHKK